jgi:hypothetical protein
MKIFSLIQEKTSNLFISSKRTKVTKKSHKKKLQLLSIKRITETMTTPIIKINKKIGTPELPTNSKRFIHLFNRINSSIGQYRNIKKRYSISSCSISVSGFIIR